MKIVTVNVPESYIDAINKLIGEDGLYPSRSELVRCAVREFLIRELRSLEDLDLEEEEEELPSNLVRVPLNDIESNKSSREFKTYKIVRRLDF